MQGRTRMRRMKACCPPLFRHAILGGERMREVSAGGVVYRKRHGGLEILMIEDRYGKMTFPKGKQEPGETIEETALREIAEETGVRGRIVRPLAVVRYQYVHPREGKTVDKEVHYFLVEATDGAVCPQVEEINEAQWLAPHEAWQRQREHGYDNNVDVLTKAYAYLGLERGTG